MIRRLQTCGPKSTASGRSNFCKLPNAPRETNSVTSTYPLWNVSLRNVINAMN